MRQRRRQDASRSARGAGRDRVGLDERGGNAPLAQVVGDGATNHTGTADHHSVRHDGSSLPARTLDELAHLIARLAVLERRLEHIDAGSDRVVEREALPLRDQSFLCANRAGAVR